MSHKRAAALGWTRVDPKPWTSKLTAVWQHVLGWSLHHCGHPTALWPWALYDPKGRMHRNGALDGAPREGRAWQRLEPAMEFVALRGEESIRIYDALDQLAGRAA